MSSPAAAIAAPMEAHQRMHLRKSSRKVEAMLGVTPIVLQVNIPAANKPAVPRPLTTPRTRARRRRAQVCQQPAPGSGSATDEDDDDKTVVESAFNSAVALSGINGFVWVEETIPHSGYLPHSLPQVVSPRRPTHRGRSKSEGGSKVSYKTRYSPLPPLPTSAARLEASPKAQGSGQPVLVVRTGLSPGVPSFRRKSPSELTFTSIMGDAPAAREPLSPLSPSPRTCASFAQAQERELRRKKMAKLTRTLGGNVPPELVFQGTKKCKVERSASVAFMPKPSGPKLSLKSNGELAIPKKFERANRPQRLSFPTFSSPGLPNFEIEQVIDSGSKSPSPIIFLPTITPSITVTEAPSLPTRVPILAVPSSPACMPQRTASQQGKGSGKLGNKYKPLETPKYASAKFTSHVPFKSTPHLGPFVPAASPGKTSLDSENPPVVHHSQSKSLADYRTPADYVYGSSGAPKFDGLTEGKVVQHTRVEQLHRRKEREWSGEWNVSDMGDVMKKLRNLKGR